jgi:hypothetical protein
MKAAKEKTFFFLVLIASALFACAPSFASSTHASTAETRAELFLLESQNRVGQSPLGPANHVEIGTELRTTALESSVAPQGTVLPGQVASAYPQGRVVGGRGHSVRPTDPPAGVRESGAWDLNQQNQRLMEAGRPPVGNDALPVELHHRNQSPNGPLDEMTSTTHNGVSHPESPSQINRNQFKGERARYWRSRIRVLLGQE